jgi:CRISPR-associated protein Csm4
MKAVYLKPRTTFRTPLRSDTLWGLLLTAIRAVYNEDAILTIIRQSEQGEPPFIVSSVMPFTEKGGVKEHLFPKPIIKPVVRGKIPSVLSREELKRKRLEMDNYKEYKKIAMLPQHIFEDMICGKISEQNFRDNSLEWKNVQKVNISSEAILHTTIDRLTCTTLELGNEGGQLYYTEDRFVKYENKADTAGLFFLMDGEMELVEGGLRFLQHFGFGGDNSVGKGFFDAEIVDFQLATPVNPTHFLTLSLYSPAESELSHYKTRKNEMWYDIETREGRIGTHFHSTGDYIKKPLVMFKEGSTFPILDQKRYGRIHTVKEMESMSIRQNGFAFTVPMVIKEAI